MPYYSGPLYADEHLLEADDTLIVNPVNCVGVMGAGVARYFRDAFPDMFRIYQIHHLLGHFQIGRALLWGCGEIAVLNVPTKAHWRGPSKVSYVRLALECNTFLAGRCPTVGRPWIGCGLDRLDRETDVKPLVDEILIEDVGMDITI